MSEYIEADALMRELEREVDLADDWKTAHEISNVVKYFPTADVRPNVHGEWKYTTHYGERYRVCTNCNTERKDDLSTGWNFCPNCGADMRGVK